MVDSRQTRDLYLSILRSFTQWYATQVANQKYSKDACYLSKDFCFVFIWADLAEFSSSDKI